MTQKFFRLTRNYLGSSTYLLSTKTLLNLPVSFIKCVPKSTTNCWKHCILHLSTLIFVMVLKFMATHTTHLSKLETLNNKILRIVQKKSKRTTDLYKFYDTLPLSLLHYYQILLLLHKIVHHPNKLPSVFRCYTSCKTDQFIIMILQKNVICTWRSPYYTWKKTD